MRMLARSTLALMLLGVPTTGWARDGQEAPATSRPTGFDVELRASLAAGAFQGWTVRKGSGALLAAEATATPVVRYERFRLELPMHLSHRQTFGLALPETRGSGGAELHWRWGPRLRLSLEGALSGAWRPGWQDLYQPLDGGLYAPTSRESHLDRRVGAQLAGIPLRHHHARLKYRFVLADYLADPLFDALGRPTHLTPQDHSRHELELSWRYLRKGFSLTARAEAFERQDYFLFARDAGTGKTHAGPGGQPPNPLQAFLGVEPSLEGEVSLFQRKLTVEARYGFELVEDLFQGYYSYTGHHPELRLEYAPVEGLAITAGLETWLRQYGEGSYAEGAGHPPLTSETRRFDRRGALALGLRVALSPGVTARVEGRFVTRRTNFPPYVPGLFPSNTAYSIDWNYDNWMALAGVEYRR